MTTETRKVVHDHVDEWYNYGEVQNKLAGAFSKGGYSVL